MATGTFFSWARALISAFSVCSRRLKKWGLQTWPLLQAWQYACSPGNGLHLRRAHTTSRFISATSALQRCCVRGTNRGSTHLLQAPFPSSGQEKYTRVQISLTKCQNKDVTASQNKYFYLLHRNNKKKTQENVQNISCICVSQRRRHLTCAFQQGGPLAPCISSQMIGQADCTVERCVTVNTHLLVQIILLWKIRAKIICQIKS